MIPRPLIAALATLFSLAQAMGQPTSILITAAGANTSPGNRAGLAGYLATMDLLTNGSMNLFGISAKWNQLAPLPGHFALQDTLLNPLTLLLPRYPAITGVVVVIKMIDTNDLPLPPDLKDRSFEDTELQSRFDALIDALVSEPSTRRITHILLGNEVDSWLAHHPAQQQPFAAFCARASRRLHDKLPGVRVGTIVTFDGMKKRPELFDTLTKFADFIAYTYYPVQDSPQWQMRPVSSVAADFHLMAERAGAKPFAFTEIGYSASPLNGSSPARQAEFVRAMFRELDPWRKTHRLEFLMYHVLYDYPPAFAAPYAETQGIAASREFRAFVETLGLHTQATGEPREAWADFAAGARAWTSPK